jgi:cysteine synthase A
MKNEKILNSIVETIGNTPLVRLNKIKSYFNIKGEIIAKLEFFNPLSSVKDRIGLSMIEEAENNGSIKKNATIIEPTSGNTGISLAAICASKGYKLILTMPESMSNERRKMLLLLGAKIVLTPANEGMVGAIKRANEMNKNIKNSIILQQFSNPSNPKIHYKTTAVEIWNDTNGKVDNLVSGVGTGGTLTGVAKFLKQKNPNIKIFAVEPEDSAILSGGPAGSHLIQGIGAGFIPENLSMELIDETISINNNTAFEFSRLLAKLEGIPVGISSGAALSAAVEINERKEMKNKKTVVIIPSFAERYLSTALFADL